MEGCADGRPPEKELVWFPGMLSVRGGGGVENVVAKTRPSLLGRHFKLHGGTGRKRSTSACFLTA